MSARGDNLFLIGPMGSGKTTIGKRVARRLGMQFIDCDRALEERTGAPVSLIFEIEGEAGFRSREKAMLESLADYHNCLIATGGGIVLDPDNCRLMRSAGRVVYLRTSIDQQIRRLSRDRQRPLLQAPDRRARLQALADERNPLYEAAADLVLAGGYEVMTDSSSDHTKWWLGVSGETEWERLAGTTFVGVYAIYFPMHYLGFEGMPRRYFAYGDTAFLSETAADVNAAITIAAIVVAVGQLLFFYNVIRSSFRGEPADGNPWKATTLEWRTPHTPPKHGNFGDELPIVYRWAYDYGVPGAKDDYIPQDVPPDETPVAYDPERHPELDPGHDPAEPDHRS